MDRVDFYHLQRVKEEELDRAFDLVERGFENVALDIGLVGVLRGGVASEQAPQAMGVALDGPLHAYNADGRRIHYDDAQRLVDLSTDKNGQPTAVTQAGYERWVSVFAKHQRLKQELRTDGLSQDVYWFQPEDTEIIVRQAPEALSGAGTRVGLLAGELLLCDVLLVHGQAVVVDADISTSRREAALVLNAENIGIDPSAWDRIAASANVQEALDNVDVALDDHVVGSAGRHSAAVIDTSPASWSSLDGANVQTALSQIDQHISGDGFEHEAGHVSVSAPAPLAGFTVQDVIEDFLDKLADIDDEDLGAGMIGFNDADVVSPNPAGVVSGDLRTQFVALLNSHTALRNTLFAAEHHIGPGAGAHVDISLTRGGGMQRLWRSSGTTNTIANAAAWIFTDGGNTVELWLTLNAQWNDGTFRWEPQTFGSVMAVRIYASTAATELGAFEILYHVYDAGGWTRLDWTRGMSLPFDDTSDGDESGWTVVGDQAQSGFCGGFWQNYSGGSTSGRFYPAVQYPAKHPTAPSAVTFTTDTQANVTFVNVATLNIQAEGLAMDVLSNSIASGAVARWHGTYLVE